MHRLLCCFLSSSGPVLSLTAINCCLDQPPDYCYSQPLDACYDPSVYIAIGALISCNVEAESGYQYLCMCDCRTSYHILCGFVCTLAQCCFSPFFFSYILQRACVMDNPDAGAVAPAVAPPGNQPPAPPPPVNR